MGQHIPALNMANHLSWWKVHQFAIYKHGCEVEVECTIKQLKLVLRTDLNSINSLVSVYIAGWRDWMYCCKSLCLAKEHDKTNVLQLATKRIVCLVLE